jgi:hypothetical protein
LTYKDLKKRVSLEVAQQSKLFERLQNKLFWIWNIDDHMQEDIRTNGDCCFNHIIGTAAEGWNRCMGSEGYNSVHNVRMNKLTGVY